MPPNELPGYYYDEVKKKYFKIQENHLAPPGSNYSRTAINKGIEFALARGREQDRRELERDQTIQRSKLLQRSLLGRELGFRKDGPGVRWDVWADGLQRRKALRVDREGLDNISQFIFDELTGSFIIAAHQRLITGVPRDSVKDEYQMTVAAFTNEGIFTIALSPSRVLMTVSEGKVQIDRLVSPQTLSPNQLTNNGSIQLRTWELRHYWASSACPHSTRSDFALGTNGGTQLVVENQTGWNLGPYQVSLKAVNNDMVTDVLAVDWQSINVVLSGCRDRTVRLWDVRVREPHGTSLRLRHSSSINHVRKLNDNAIIVAGIEGQICTYDLRFLPNIDTFYGLPPTRPFTTFPEYRRNKNHIYSEGFDVSEKVVAAGMADDHEHHGVLLFDAKSGRQMKASIRDKRPGVGPPRCVKLIGGSDLWPAPSLMYSSGNGLNRWS